MGVKEQQREEEKETTKRETREREREKKHKMELVFGHEEETDETGGDQGKKC